MTDDVPADGGAGERGDHRTSGPSARSSEAAGDTFPDPETTARYLQWGALAAFSLLGVIAAVGMYTSAGRVIDLWVTERYQPVVRTVFNAALLLASTAGVSAVLRELDDD
jgi:hypothetical protein